MHQVLPGYPLGPGLPGNPCVPLLPLRPLKPKTFKIKRKILLLHNIIY